MPFNVNNFRAKLSAGGARPTQFRVLLTGPGYAGMDTEQMSFMCKAAQHPQSQIGNIERGYMGSKVKFAGDRTYEPWTVTVVNDETFDLRNQLEVWQSGIASHTTRNNAQRGLGATSNPLSYVGRATVEQFGKEGNVVKTYTLVNVFPESVGSIDLDWDTNDTIEEFQVTFQYDYFETPDGIV